jgi:hypothetical protein
VSGGTLLVGLVFNHNRLQWFAVIALFHHPLNLEVIPHTNIISRPAALRATARRIHPARVPLAGACRNADSRVQFPPCGSHGVLARNPKLRIKSFPLHQSVDTETVKRGLSLVGGAGAHELGPTAKTSLRYHLWSRSALDRCPNLVRMFGIKTYQSRKT